MRYVKLGRTGLEVSPTAQGCMTYGDPARGHPVWSLPEEESHDLIKQAAIELAADEVAWLESPYTPRADHQRDADDARTRELSAELGITLRAQL